LSFDNGTVCWMGFRAGSWDSPPLSAGGRSRALSVTLLAVHLIRHMPEMEMQAEHLGSNPCLQHVVNCQGMGLASSSVAAAAAGDPKWTMPPWPGENFKPALFCTGDRGSGADVQLPGPTLMLCRCYTAKFGILDATSSCSRIAAAS
jgi:hypothetical protein